MSSTPKVSDEMNVRLVEPYTEEEIRRALVEMYHEKVPGVTFFRLCFIKDFGAW